MEHSKGKWSVGKKFTNTVITDNPEGFKPESGHASTGYYGGYLIAESIYKPEDAKLIAAAPDMHEVLTVISEANDDVKCLPETVLSMVKAALKKASGK